ncbi:hypothetical protein [Streptomyces sp. PSAA01]|uniref:hypothetical protein n=1 Tax=Streptomyces sp. PSAA01 TaxID=2912762 RepID=UPI001F2231C4|nr:hypothetical protein [Streptomyces sp. PSAA01]MCG0285204.1 hypothetical protein [Streptomyces sp. PSAA01]
MPTYPQVLLWTPSPAVDVEALPAGKWWDAVRAAPTVGERALQLLGDATGAVIQDKHGPLYWLVAVGSATSWHLRQVRVLTELADEKTYLGVPPVSWTEGPETHWRVPLTADHYLTDAGKLWGALAEADRAVLGPVPQGRRTCYRCELPTDEPDIVVKRWDYEALRWREMLREHGFTDATARVLPAPPGPRKIGTMLVRATA